MGFFSELLNKRSNAKLPDGYENSLAIRKGNMKLFFWSPLADVYLMTLIARADDVICRLLIC